MSIISIILLAKILHFLLVGFFPPSSVPNLVSEVSGRLVSCLPVDSGAAGL